MENIYGIIAKVFIVIIAIEHIYILWMEMFAWETVGKKTFKGALPEEMFKMTKGLAANQGLYNGFLAAGLIWSMLVTESAWQQHIATFFLGCVAVAGIYGGLTASRRVLYVQALPALLGLLFLLLSKG